MKTKTAIQKLKPLLKATSFTSVDAKKRGVTASTLAHYVTSGDLERLARGLYRGSGARPFADFRWEDLVTAIKQTKGGVICLISALALYDMTEEIPRVHWIAVENTTRHRAGPSVKVIRFRNIKLGKTTIEIGGDTLPIFDRERTIVDAFRFLSIETAIKALRAGLRKKAGEKIDYKKLEKYARALRVNIAPYILAETT